MAGIQQPQETTMADDTSKRGGQDRTRINTFDNRVIGGAVNGMGALEI